MEPGTFADGARYRYDYKIVFKNKGKHPAKNLKIQTKIPGNNTILVNSYETPNRIDQESLLTADGNVFMRDLASNVNPVFIILDLEYEDYLQDKKYKERHWQKFVGGNSIPHATITEKNTMEMIERIVLAQGRVRL